MIGWRRTTSVARTRSNSSSTMMIHSGSSGSIYYNRPATTIHMQHATVTRRHYWYLPTSWRELELRWRPVVPRTIRIELLPANKQWKQLPQHLYKIYKNRYRTKFQRNVLKFRHNYQSKLQTLNGKFNTQRLQSKYRHFQHQTSILKQSFRLKRNNWNKRRRNYLVKLQKRWKLFMRLQRVRFLNKEVHIPEYSECHWFGDYGRPLTSKDETGRFVNPWQSTSTDGVQSVWDIARWQCGRLLSKLHDFWTYDETVSRRLQSLQPIVHTHHPPATTPSLDDHQLQTTWLGHATCLLQTKDHCILTDPIFSNRAGPRQELPIGVIRDIPVSTPISELPETIDVCLISHDHYDHLDKDSILELHERVQRFVVPLGLKEWLIDQCNVPAGKITELEWWQSLDVGSDNLYFGGPSVPSPSSSSLMVTCCPAQHWASRTFWDRNYRLWCSFFLQLPSSRNRHRVFFCGDTGYTPTFPLFPQIQSYCGTPDLSLLPIGAYEPAFYNSNVHMTPEQALRVHFELQSKLSLGIHWGTFALAEEPLWEPKLRLDRAARGANFQTVRPGVSVITESSLLDEEDWVPPRGGLSTVN